MPTDVSAGGHVFITATTALMFSECYDEAERAVRAGARRRPPARRPASASRRPPALRSLLLYRRGALAAAEAEAVAALDLRNDVHGAQGYLACALNTFVFAALDRGTGGPELLALADDFFATQPSEDLPYSQAMHARGWLQGRAGRPRGRARRAARVRRARARVGRRARRRSSRGGRRRPRSACGSGGWSRRARWRRRRSRWRARSARRGRSGSRCAHPRWRNRARGGSSCCARRVASLEASQGALELARTRIDLGAALVRAGQREEARELLRAGQEGAAGCGATPLVERAHRELLATGARPRRTAAAGRDGLTPSELRVTEMAAAGQTNREIAQALFVTEKTVETHLGRAFMKLGVRSRKQLAQALDREPAEVV